MKNFISLSPTFFCCLLVGLIASGQYSGPNIRVADVGDFSPQQLYDQLGAQDSLAFWKEHIVLHTDKDLLAPKDHLFFKAYILTGLEQKRISQSGVLRVELLNANGDLLTKQYHSIRDGIAEGSFEIPKKVKKGDYYFRAYTHWMLNYGPEQFAVKKIRVESRIKENLGEPIADSGIAVFPEGGQMVVGLANRVALALHDQFETIVVIDNMGNEVANVKNFEVGFGTFLLQPEEGQHYALLINGIKTIPLPEVHDLGYTLQVNNLREDNTVVHVAVSKSLKDQAAYLKGIADGITYFNIKMEFNDEGKAEIEIPKKELPIGGLLLQLEDEFEQVWAQRPVLVERDDLNIAIEKSKDDTKDGNLVFKVTDGNGMPVRTELSVAITTAIPNDQTAHMTADTKRNKRFIDDLLLLTNQKSTNGLGFDGNRLPEKINYNFQSSLDFYGQAYDLDNSLLSDTKIQLLISNEDDVAVREVRTNSDGLFKLSGLQFQGDVTMVFRTVGEETKNRLVRVIPFEYDVPPMFENRSFAKTTQIFKEPEKTVNKRFVFEFESEADTGELIALEEVTLIEKKVERKYKPSTYGINPDRVVYQDAERPKPIPQLFLTIPGVRILRLGDIENVSVSLPRAAGVGLILWVLDGLPLVQPTSLGEIMSLVPYLDVERIEILYGPQASIYGTRAAGGAILLYTRSGDNVEHLARKDAQLTFQGFHESLDFETYTKLKSKKVKNPDFFERTLYWNPVLKTDEQGEVRFSLPPLENTKRIRINAKVITEDGKRANLEQVLHL